MNTVQLDIQKGLRYWHRHRISCKEFRMKQTGIWLFNLEMIINEKACRDQICTQTANSMQ